MLDHCQRTHWLTHAHECKASDPDAIESIRNKKEEGNSLFSQGDYESAINLFSQALQV